MESANMRGIATGEWVWSPDEFKAITTARALLEACEAVRSQTLTWWPKLTVERMVTVEQDPFFGPAQSHFDRIHYTLENEIHHRGQGFVYLRILGKEPPLFYER
ncbi:MAG TPA: DinB family protein [Symbiobacteriaceae bacterium]|nr:DinB family protein [Symbiobacteriaceae bacterium]